MDPQIEQNLTNRERNELKRQEKLEAKEAVIQKRQTGKTVRWITWSAFGIVVVGGLVWLVASQPETLESNIVSRNGFHWHPELTIYVKGEKQEFLANIGIGAVHQPIHTHDDAKDGIVHLEFQGLVQKQDIVLGQFFKSWRKDFNSFGVNVKMTVNGKENTELENYVMQDKDKIELRYE